MLVNKLNWIELINKTIRKTYFERIITNNCIAFECWWSDWKIYCRQVVTFHYHLSRHQFFHVHMCFMLKNKQKQHVVQCFSANLTFRSAAKLISPLSSATTAQIINHCIATTEWHNLQSHNSTQTSTITTSKDKIHKCTNAPEQNVESQNDGNAIGSVLPEQQALDHGEELFCSLQDVALALLSLPALHLLLLLLFASGLLLQGPGGPSGPADVGGQPRQPLHAECRWLSWRGTACLRQQADDEDVGCYCCCGLYRRRRRCLAWHA